MWFGGWSPPGLRLDGARSVLLPLPSGRLLKIKGAGYLGSELRWGEFRRTGPKALRFDFEGRVAEDVAAGHDAAQAGACSFQQAAVEWQVSRRLAAAGLPAAPCLGFGRLGQDGRAAWFSVFEWQAGWLPDTQWPDVTRALFVTRAERAGAWSLRLAVELGLVGYPWTVRDGAGREWIKDLHPFVELGPVNGSQLTWVMQCFYALHIIASDIRLHAERWPPGALQETDRLAMFRPLVPDVTVADHEDARARILMPFMLAPQPGFCPEVLAQTLAQNRITAALMAACPEGYARFG